MTILSHGHLVQLIQILILRCVCGLCEHYDVLYKQREAEHLEVLEQGSVVNVMSAVVVNQSATNPPLLVNQDVFNPPFSADQDAFSPPLSVDQDEVSPSLLVDPAVAVAQPVDVSLNQDQLLQL